jgi:hypothetical protein
MLEMILIFCFLADPSRCYEHRAAYDVSTLSGCLVEGQRVAAVYIHEHPHVILKKVRCQWGEKTGSGLGGSAAPRSMGVPPAWFIPESFGIMDVSG